MRTGTFGFLQGLCPQDLLSDLKICKDHMKIVICGVELSMVFSFVNCTADPVRDLILCVWLPQKNVLLYSQHKGKIGIQ